VEKGTSEHIHESKSFITWIGAKFMAFIYAKRESFLKTRILSLDKKKGWDLTGSGSATLLSGPVRWRGRNTKRNKK
jgi:hypothetical protein